MNWWSSFLKFIGWQPAVDRSQRLAGRAMIEALREAGPFTVEIVINISGGVQTFRIQVRIPPEA